MSNRKRNRAVTVRMTEQELDSIKALVCASGQTFQAYIINSALGATISTKEEIDAIKDRNDIYEDIHRQLRGLATNVNQLAHQANRGGQLPLMYELYKLEEEFNAFKNEVRQVWHSEKYETAALPNNQQIRKDKTDGNSESC